MTKGGGSRHKGQIGRDKAGRKGEEIGNGRTGWLWRKSEIRTACHNPHTPISSPSPCAVRSGDDDTVDITEIGALRRERGFGAATIGWLRQLHASGECDYLATRCV